MDKMVVELDERKIISDGIYRLDSVWNNIDLAFDREGFTKTGKGIYEQGDFTKCARMQLHLSNTPWFLRYVKTWLWYEDEDLYSPDDVYEFYKEKGLIKDGQDEKAYSYQL